MVTIITEKLRNQSLDDVKVEQVPNLQASGNAWTLAASSSSAFNLRGTKSWAMLLDRSDHPKLKDDPGGSAAVMTAADAELGVKGGAASRAGSQHSSHAAIEVPFFRTHNQYDQFSTETDPISNTPPAPPLKRHCRSLSIPGDIKNDKKWQPQPGQIWRPVATRSHYGNTKHSKSRNSPLGAHHRPISSRSSPLAHQSQCPNPPVVAPAVGAASAIWPLSKSEDLSTPPDSPVPRPASASSGFCDGSFRSLNSPWRDTSPVRSTSSNKTFNCIKHEAFRWRSLSMEEPISRLRWSARSSCPAATQQGSRSHHSTPPSPRKQRVPRCRSQPCVLHDRKCLKRRRDEERPALDFLKMTETAYDHGGWRLSSQYLPEYMRSSRSLASLFSEQPTEWVLGLNTIASSPLDSSTLPSSVSSPSGADGDSDRLTDSVVSAKCAEEDGKKGSLGGGGEDSGCSDTNEAADTEDGFVDSEANSCSCDDYPNQGREDGEMFELEMNSDIDLEKIEKD